LVTQRVHGVPWACPAGRCPPRGQTLAGNDSPGRYRNRDCRSRRCHGMRTRQARHDENVVTCLSCGAELAGCTLRSSSAGQRQELRRCPAFRRLAAFVS
jgi:hypothetical protein